MVKLVVEIRTRKSTVKLSCTTRDLKVKEIVRRKRKAKKDNLGTGITTAEKEAAAAIQGSGPVKEGDESEQPESPANL